MASIIQVSTGDIYPGLIVAIFLGIVNLFIFLLLLANRKLPVGGRFLKVQNRTPSLTLAELPQAFPDWDTFTTFYEDVIKAYRTNYEKLTGVELEESEVDEEEDREIKPFTIMEDFGNLFPQKAKTATEEIVYHEVGDKGILETSKVADGSNIFVGKDASPTFAEGKLEAVNEAGESEEKDLFGNQELKRFFGYGDKIGFRGFTNDDELENRRKTAKYVPMLAPGFQDMIGDDGRSNVREREPTAKFLQPFREEKAGWNIVSDHQEEHSPSWKPFVVGEFHRKSLNLEDDEDVGSAGYNAPLDLPKTEIKGLKK